MCGYVVLGPYNVKVSEHYASIYFIDPVSLLSFMKNGRSFTKVLFYDGVTIVSSNHNS